MTAAEKGTYLVQVYNYDPQGRAFDLEVWGSGPGFRPAEDDGGLGPKGRRSFKGG